jgi:hypothetical protein
LAIRIFLALLLAAIGFATPAWGSVLTVSVNVGTPSTVNGVAAFMVSDQTMGPMQVTAYFSDNTSQTAVWDNLTGQAVAPVDPRFRLAISGDTYFNIWFLTNHDSTHALQTLVIDALAGNTAFDLQGPTFSTVNTTVTPGKIDETEGTGDSEKGSTFHWENAMAFHENSADVDIDATYSNILNVVSESAVGDLWGQLTLSIAPNPQFGTIDGLISQGEIHFYADTDLIEPLRQVSNPVPEPASAMIFAGLGLVAGWRGRRRWLVHS